MSMDVTRSACARAEGPSLVFSFEPCRRMCGPSLAGRAGVLEESEANINARAVANWQDYGGAHTCAGL